MTVGVTWCVAHRYSETTAGPTPGVCAQPDHRRLEAAVGTACQGVCRHAARGSGDRIQLTARRCGGTDVGEAPAPVTIGMSGQPRRGAVEHGQIS